MPTDADLLATGDAAAKRPEQRPAVRRVAHERRVAALLAALYAWRYGGLLWFGILALAVGVQSKVRSKLGEILPASLSAKA